MLLLMSKQVSDIPTAVAERLMGDVSSLYKDKKFTLTDVKTVMKQLNKILYYHGFKSYISKELFEHMILNPNKEFPNLTIEIDTENLMIDYKFRNLYFDIDQVNTYLEKYGESKIKITQDEGDDLDE